METVELIEGIRANRVIWDTDDKYYHNKKERYEAWVRIARSLFPNFDLMTADEQHQVVDQLRQKWKYLRTRFFDRLKIDLKAEKGCSTRRGPEFPYSMEMSFLKDQLSQKFAEGAAQNKLVEVSTSLARNARLRKPTEFYNSSKFSPVKRSSRLRKPTKFYDSSTFLTDDISVANEQALTDPGNCSHSKKYPTVKSKCEPQRMTSARKEVNNYRIPGAGRSSIPEKQINRPNHSTPMPMPDQRELMMDRGSNWPSPQQKNDINDAVKTLKSVKLNNMKIPSLYFWYEENCGEDVAFFHSLLTWIRHFNDDEKLQFRSETMRVIQQIRDARKKDDYYVLSRAPVL